jgi:hypothetical protein
MEVSSVNAVNLTCAYYSSSASSDESGVQRRWVDRCIRGFFQRAENRIRHGFHFADSADDCPHLGEGRQYQYVLLILRGHFIKH